LPRNPPKRGSRPRPRESSLTRPVTFQARIRAFARARPAGPVLTGRPSLTPLRPPPMID
jgi:hypothetical protein